MESTDFVSLYGVREEWDRTYQRDRSWIFAVDVDDDGCKGNQLEHRARRIRCPMTITALHHLQHPPGYFRVTTLRPLC